MSPPVCLFVCEDEIWNSRTIEKTFGGQPLVVAGMQPVFFSLLVCGSHFLIYANRKLERATELHSLSNCFLFLPIAGGKCVAGPLERFE